MMGSKKRLANFESLIARRAVDRGSPAPPSREFAAVPTRADIVADRARRACDRKYTTMNVVRAYSTKIDPREEARIRKAWLAEIEKLETDDEVREWFAALVIGRRVGEHRRALRLRKKGARTLGIGGWTYLPAMIRRDCGRPRPRLCEETMTEASPFNGNNVGRWKTIPTRRRSASGSMAATFSPWNRTDPPVATSSRLHRRSIVVLPAPDGPRRTVTPPVGTAAVTPVEDAGAADLHRHVLKGEHLVPRVRSASGGRRRARRCGAAPAEAGTN
jgi:hypothetical protein